MSVCPIGLAIVLGVCGAPRARQPAPNAPAAIVERSEPPAAIAANQREQIAPEEAKRNGKPSSVSSSGALPRSISKSKQHRPVTARSCPEKSCPGLKPACHHPDS